MPVLVYAVDEKPVRESDDSSSFLEEDTDGDAMEYQNWQHFVQDYETISGSTYKELKNL